MINENRVKGDLISNLFLVYDYLKFFNVDDDLLKEFRIIIGKLYITLIEREPVDND